ncbi:MAG TPA: gamma-glutamyl-phosphate reductase, partial [Mariniphaga sp.]|nr:gamma-glutamyl-phosphate reductase [Mariniphaga sp.]
MKIQEQLQKVLNASRKLNLIKGETIRKVLIDLANEAENKSAYILAENQKDLDRMDPEDPKYDRLKLTTERIQGIANDIRSVAEMESPVGKVLKEIVRPNGLKISKITVPFGVIGIIY